MNWITTVIIGGVVGWLASIVMKTSAQMGLVANVLVGIAGSVLGSAAAVGLGIAPAGGVTSFAVALLAAIALIFLLRALGIFNQA